MIAMIYAVSQKVSTPTIRSRILKEAIVVLEVFDHASFNPNDPFEDTER